MIGTNLENAYFAIRLELKERGLALLKEINSAIEGKKDLLFPGPGMPMTDYYKGKEIAFEEAYEMFFGVLTKRPDGSIDPAALQYKIEKTAKELKELLKQ